jgi:hypothetical protein
LQAGQVIERLAIIGSQFQRLLELRYRRLAITLPAIQLGQVEMIRWIARRTLDCLLKRRNPFGNLTSLADNCAP